MPSRCWTPTAKAVSTRTSECGSGSQGPKPTPRPASLHITEGKPVLALGPVLGLGAPWAKPWGRRVCWALASHRP